MAEPESPARETESAESYIDLTDECFENIAHSVEVISSETEEDGPNVSKETSKSNLSGKGKRKRCRKRAKTRTPEPWYQLAKWQLSITQSQQPEQFPPKYPDDSNSTVSKDFMQNVVINNIVESLSTNSNMLQAPVPPIMTHGQRILPYGPNIISRPTFMPTRSDFMDRPNFQPYHSSNSDFMAHPNVMMKQQLPNFPFSSPPPVLPKPTEKDEHTTFLEIRSKKRRVAQAFEDGNIGFLESLRRISEQTRKKEAEAEAKMKAELEKERVRAEQAKKAEDLKNLLSGLKKSSWTPVGEPSTGGYRYEPSLSTFMVILPPDYPNSIVRLESFKYVEEKISMAMQRHYRVPSNFKIDIRNIEPRQGVIAVTCGDVATTKWLRDVVPSMKSSFECKSLEEAKLLPSFELSVDDPKARFERVQRSIAEKRTITSFWKHLVSHDLNVTLPTPGRKFFFLGDDALREKLKREGRLVVQIDQTNASIKYIDGIGEGSFSSNMIDKWSERKRELARERSREKMDEQKNLKNEKKCQMRALLDLELPKSEPQKKVWRKNKRQLKTSKQRQRLKKKLAKLRRDTLKAERELGENLQELDVQNPNKRLSRKAKRNKALQSFRLLLGGASVAHQNEAPLTGQQEALANANEYN